MRVRIRRLFAAQRPDDRVRAQKLGQSFAEFALILPVFLLVVLIGLDFGRAYIGYVGLQQTTRIAANFASIHAEAWNNPKDQETIDKYRELIKNDSSSTNCVLPTPDNKIPDPVFADPTLKIGSAAVVNLTCTFRTLTPFIQAILPQNVKITARSTFPIRRGAFVGAPSAGAKPVANFLCLPASGTVPLSINCTDNSTQSPTAWTWNFGDGTTSNEQNPYDPGCSCSHQYTTDGLFTLSLIATNVHGSSTPKTVTITVNPLNPGPVANFTWSPLTGIVAGSTTVQFTDTSTNTPTSWAWDFDSSTVSVDSTAQNPTHLYSAAGTYSVTLTATNSGGSNSITKQLTVNSPPTCGPVPNFINRVVRSSTVGQFQTDWNAAGFTTTIFWSPNGPFPSGGSKKVSAQSLPANTFQLCGSSITLTWPG